MPVTEANDPHAGLQQLQEYILENLSGLPDIVLLNITDISELLADPDTIIIGQDIIIDPEGNIKLSTSTQNGKMAPVERADLPQNIQTAVEEALKAMLPSEINKAQTPPIVINILGLDEDLQEDEIGQTKDLVRTYVRERSGLKVNTEDSEEVVGPAY